MSIHSLTKEQKQVVLHPLGSHARVLAVAGSGKTTTMVHRIDHLVREQAIPPENIFVVMFNKLARFQFRDKLHKKGLLAHQQPNVHTFHSSAFKIIKDASTRGILPDFKNLWVQDKAELARYNVHRAIQNLEENKRIPTGVTDPDEAIEAIALWKNSLIPPQRAGHHFNHRLPLVYEEFEKLRISKYALTFDDFVPLAVGTLENDPVIRKLWCNKASIIIVDEYQDVNLGQQRLLELMAGDKADVMVVGDDDQTIYEWRGANPGYILNNFKSKFKNKPHALYQLPHSFRFGPVIAQCAQNVIDCNLNRIKKPLIAHAMEKKADIHVFRASAGQQSNPHISLADKAREIVKETHDPANVIVLGRTYSQLNELETVFLSKKIPYRVVGRKPFFERHEIQVLLDYVKLAMRLDEHSSRQTQQLLLSIANTPNRKLGKNALIKSMSSAHQRKESTREALIFLSGNPMSPYNQTQQGQIGQLLQHLELIKEKAAHGDMQAGSLLQWLVELLDYLKHFDDYYGQGESSEERKQAVLTFCRFASGCKMNITSFLSLVARLDTTQGTPEKHQIIMTSIFKTKGLEYDYVFIPNCTNRYMPCRVASQNKTFDTAGINLEPAPSHHIENERRLFYVAITRARKSVYIGTSCFSASAENPYDNGPSPFLEEIAREPTVEVMTALQGWAAGKPEAENMLLTNTSRNRGLKSIIDNLLSHYLKGKRFKTINRKIRRLFQEQPEKEVANSDSTSFLPNSHEQTTAFSEDKPWWLSDDQY